MLRKTSLALALSLIACSQAFAQQNFIWIGPTETNGVEDFTWGNLSNWNVQGQALNAPNRIFSDPAKDTSLLNNYHAASSLTFSTSHTVNGGTVTGSGQTLPNRLTVGSGGMTVASGATATFNGLALRLGSNQTWTNNGSIFVTGTPGIESVGTFEMQGSGTLTVDGAVANNGGMTFSGSGDSTIGGAISGTGVITVSGGGTLSLNSSNSHTGGTNLISGTIEASTSSSLGSGTVTMGGTSGTRTLLLANGTTTSNSLFVNSGSGSSRIEVDSGSAVYAGGINTSEVASRFLLRAGSGNTLTVSGDITGSGGFSTALSGTVILAGSNNVGGTISLNSRNTLITGSTTTIGNLNVNGSSILSVGDGAIVGANAMTVGANAMLNGTGTINANVVVNGTHSVGGDSVGDTLGTQVVTGDLAYAATSKFVWQLNDDSENAADFDRVTGIKELSFDAGAEFVFDFGAGVDFADSFWNMNRSWTIFEASTVTVTGLANLGFTQPTGLNGMFSFTENGSGDVVLNFNVTAVPEPTTFAMFGLSMAGIGFVRRRKVIA